uniref:Major facilitator superfamily (MFS) profile domain-containing protein n=1 Tax=Craspedostauros australis TaxID=1486917 RepID=A0A7S0F4L8_9STRA
MTPKSSLDDAGPHADVNADASENPNNNNGGDNYGSIAFANGMDSTVDPSATTSAGKMEQPPDQSKSVSYWDLMSHSSGFRYFMSSYMITMVGEWLTYVATITFIEEQMSHTSRTAISILILIRLIPNVLFAGVGGTLADTVDRRKLMIVLDISGALSALFFIVAYNRQSIGLMYAATFVQNCIAGLYGPSFSSILPMLVPVEGEYLQKANVVGGIAWSLTMSVGSAFGGYIAGVFGSNVCFLLDSLTYLASAGLLFCISGNYKATEVFGEDGSTKPLLKDTHNKNSAAATNEGGGDDDAKGSRDPEPEKQGVVAMTLECLDYLNNSYFGLLVFMKASSCFAYGGVDVINVAISEEDPTANTSMRLGFIFACLSGGALIGPFVFEIFTSLDRPWTSQIACIVALVFIGIGLAGWVIFDAFWVQCIFATIRVIGSATIYIDSDLMLQRFTKPTMLGRVMGLVYSTSLFAEAASAFLCGYIMDLDPEFFTIKVMSTILSGIAFLFAALWTAYHLSGRGGAHPDALKNAQQHQAKEVAARSRDVSRASSNVTEAADPVNLPEIA